MASGFINNAIGLSGPAGLASWAVAGVGAYYLFYLPEQRKAQEELERAANAERLMKGKQYTEFVAQHEAAKTGARKGWFGVCSEGRRIRAGSDCQEHGGTRSYEYIRCTYRPPGLVVATHERCPKEG